MSAQQVRSAVPADHRSIHPGFSGLPWWGAILLALTATAVGFAFDAGSGDKELTHVFGALYALGCVAAVLAVRQSAVFTAVIQPPLILFGAVPGAYWLFHDAALNGLKSIAINCGYPLIERFPLMAFTSATVLLIGLARWYLGTLARSGAAKADDAVPASLRWLTSALTSALEMLGTKLSAIIDRNPAHVIKKTETRRRRPADRSSRTSAADRRSSSARRTTRSAPTRSRHVRPQFDDAPESRGEYPRRRPRPAQDSGRHDQPAPRVRRDSHPHAGERRTARTGRDRPAEPAEPPRRRAPAATNGATNSSGGTHHPVSRVRYRGSDSDVDYRSERRRPPEPRNTAADNWQYDI